MQARARSELAAQIKAFQDIIREALNEGLSAREDADLAEIIEALRVVVREEDLASPVGGDSASGAAAHPRRKPRTTRPLRKRTDQLN